MNRGGLTAYDVVDRYDDDYFADLAERYRSRNRFARQRLRNVFSLMPSLAGRRLIDLGCGMGTFTIETARKGAAAVGIDSMPAALRAALRVAASESVDGARFVRADAARLPIRDAAADIVLAADLTEHLDDDTLARVLSEAARALTPGGTLVLYTPERKHLFERLRDLGVLKQDASHIGVRGGGELEAAVRAAGLTEVRLRYLPSHLPGWNLFERALGRWVPLLRRRIGLTARKPAP